MLNAKSKVIFIPLDIKKCVYQSESVSGETGCQRTGPQYEYRVRRVQLVSCVYSCTAVYCSQYGRTTHVTR